ncbi:hypothetical protein KEF85_07525 [Methylomonas paludis]|uniref:Uncharacterized protein n=1 Tax=Methylomonas paludis TaxID=1173101 RepID=A0A975RAL9_9GAMM|nr:hypothetical protein [Methylomonas paludis]QWF72287.1 hypothetical protein KEF85_07525 [Methylomonas paludis]
MAMAVALEPYNVIDGVTAASTIQPTAVPILKLSSTPPIINNIVSVSPGQTVTIDLSGRDPNGYNSYLYMGIFQAGNFYPPNTSGLKLAKGAKFKNGSNNTKAVYTWTAPAGSASIPPVVVQFGVYNSYGSGNQSAQTVTLKSIDATGPSFAPTMKAVETVYANLPVSYQVVVDADVDKDNVIISATNLPAGASLTPAAKNKKGQWLANLVWTPSLDELGQTNISFTAQDVNETQTIPQFTTNFTVLNVVSPAFAVSMPSQENAAVNKTLTYKVILNPDPHTNKILISASGLPPKAVLSKPKLVKGQVIATLTWKPTKAELNQVYPVTFSAVDNLPGAPAVEFNSTFTVTSK